MESGANLQRKEMAKMNALGVYPLEFSQAILCIALTMESLSQRCLLEAVHVIQ